MRPFLPLIVATTLGLLTVQPGCSSGRKMMPTPNLYGTGHVNPYTEVPPALQNNKVEVLYLTDRKPEESPTTQPVYGYERSRSVYWGVATVELGKDLSWGALVQASLDPKRSQDVEVMLTRIVQLGEFPPTPKTLIVHPDAKPTDLERAPQSSEAGIAFSKELSARLALTPQKDVYIFVHGYNNGFDSAVSTIAELWHFFGRQGVPIAYTWPAGRGGLLRGYTYDRESSEFTVFHLKQMLLLIAANPDVQRIHVIAHSRGTDVASSALRELSIEFSSVGKSTREQLKLQTLVLAAPDMDFDVVVQRFVTARLGNVPRNFTMYVCSKDKALGISNWLFSGLERLGQIRSDVFTKEDMENLRASRHSAIVDARVSNAGDYGHDYFYSNPAVSSDLILLVRYGRAAGPENGRPLKIDPTGFWVIDDSYPGTGMPAETTQPAQ